MIDLDRARELLAQAVATQGRDFSYTNDQRNVGCFYRPLRPDEVDNPDDPRTKTGCLVGTALTLAGETEHLYYEGMVIDLQSYRPNMMTVEAARYFFESQISQDGGNTWGMAHDIAEESLMHDKFD